MPTSIDIILENGKKDKKRSNGAKDNSSNKITKNAVKITSQSNKDDKEDESKSESISKNGDEENFRSPGIIQSDSVGKSKSLLLLI